MRRLGLGLDNETTFFALETITAFVEQGGFVMVDETNGTDGTKRFAKCSLPPNHELRMLVPLCAKDTATQFRHFLRSCRIAFLSFCIFLFDILELALKFTLMVVKAQLKRRWKIELIYHDESPNV